MPAITLPDGSKKQYDQPVTVMDVAADIGPGLAKATLAGEVDGKLRDASFVIEGDAALRIITARDPEGVEVIDPAAQHGCVTSTTRLGGQLLADTRQFGKIFTGSHHIFQFFSQAADRTGCIAIGPDAKWVCAIDFQKIGDLIIRFNWRQKFNNVRKIVSVHELPSFINAPYDFVP